MAFGAVYAVGGWLILWIAFSLGYFYLAYPFMMGFALLSPFGAAGTYEISRRLETGEPLSWAVVFAAVWNRSGKDLGWLALVSLFTLIIWLDLAVLPVPGVLRRPCSIVCAAFHQHLHHDLRADVLPRRQRRRGDIALIVFSFTAVSPPLVVDRNVDFVTAMTTSVQAVLANPRTMLAWAVVIGMDLAVSFVTLFVALLVIFPVLGHTTWHLYRRLID